MTQMVFDAASSGKPYSARCYRLWKHLPHYHCGVDLGAPMSYVITYFCDGRLTKRDVTVAR